MNEPSRPTDAEVAAAENAFNQLTYELGEAALGYFAAKGRTSFTQQDADTVLHNLRLGGQFAVIERLPQGQAAVWSRTVDLADRTLRGLFMSHGEPSLDWGLHRHANRLDIGTMTLLFYWAVLFHLRLAITSSAAAPPEAGQELVALPSIADAWGRALHSGITQRAQDAVATARRSSAEGEHRQPLISWFSSSWTTDEPATLAARFFDAVMNLLELSVPDSSDRWFSETFTPGRKRGSPDRGILRRRDQSVEAFYRWANVAVDQGILSAASPNVEPPDSPTIDRAQRAERRPLRDPLAATRSGCLVAVSLVPVLLASLARVWVYRLRDGRARPS